MVSLILEQSHLRYNTSIGHPMRSHEHYLHPDHLSVGMASRSVYRLKLFVPPPSRWLSGQLSMGLVPAAATPILLSATNPERSIGSIADRLERSWVPNARGGSRTGCRYLGRCYHVYKENVLAAAKCSLSNFAVRRFRRYECCYFLLCRSRMKIRVVPVPDTEAGRVQIGKKKDLKKSIGKKPA